MFYVLSGTATFETEAGEVTVDAGEAIRFVPGEFQQGVQPRRRARRRAGRAVDADTSEVRLDCPDCGGRTEASIERDDDGLLTRRPEYGAVTGRFD